MDGAELRKEAALLRDGNIRVKLHDEAAVRLMTLPPPSLNSRFYDDLMDPFDHSARARSCQAKVHQMRMQAKALLG